MSSGNDQRNISPQITPVEGRPSFQRMRAVECRAGQTVTIRWVMHDTKGDPVNFSDIPSATIKARIRETLSFNDDNPPVEVVGTIVDAAQGRVDIQVPAVATEYPGISRVEIAVLDDTGSVVFTNECWLIVNRGQWAKDVEPNGPPSIAEIRLHLRDSGPEDNLWRDIEEFDLAEIAACIERPVLYWNESPPPIPVRFNTVNFPFRYNWLNGIIACLYQLAARWYRRVHLPYSAGGLSVDDKNKSQEYELIGQRLWEEYKQWVLMKKVQMNMDAGWGTLSSPYSRAPSW